MAIIAALKCLYHLFPIWYLNTLQKANLNNRLKPQVSKFLIHCLLIHIQAYRVIQCNVITYAAFSQGGLSQCLIISISNVSPVGLRLWTKLTWTAFDPQPRTSQPDGSCPQGDSGLTVIPLPGLWAATTYTPTLWSFKSKQVLVLYNIYTLL